MDRMTWSRQEKQIARRAFDKAYRRECDEIIQDIRNARLEAPQDIWALESMLDERRRRIDATYDYRYSRLILIFAVLMRQGYLTFEDLDGLAEDKLERIRFILEFDPASR